MAIKSFRCAQTHALFETGRSKRFGSLARIATRKLTMLHSAATLDSLRAPPGNRLEALVKDRAGQHSIPDQRSISHLLCLDGGRTDESRDR